MKYFNQERATDLQALLKNIEISLTSSKPDRAELTRLFDNRRKLKNELDALPTRFEVGDGANTGGNGDRRPYRVIEVSKSGKTVKMQSMNYNHIEGTSKEYGHENWEVSNDPEGHVITATCRKNGRWAQKGHTSTGGYGNFSHGACYSYNWSL
jgi:hypothetical protein